MLVLNDALFNRPIASVQSGHRVAVSGEMIIDPRDLKIFAFHVSAPNDPDLVLHTEDIRNVTTQGFVIDNNDQLMQFDDDLVRLKKVSDIDFKLLEKPVYTEDKKKLGKIMDFVIETDGFSIMKLHVSRSMMKSFGTSQLIIDRSQVVEITDDKIIVKSATTKQKTGGLKQTLFGKPLNLSADPIKSKSQKN